MIDPKTKNIKASMGTASNSTLKRVLNPTGCLSSAKGADSGLRNENPSM